MDLNLFDEYYWLQEKSRERLKAAEHERLCRLLTPPNLGGRAKLRLADLMIETGLRLKDQVERRTLIVVQEQN